MFGRFLDLVTLFTKKYNSTKLNFRVTKPSKLLLSFFFLKKQDKQYQKKFNSIIHFLEIQMLAQTSEFSVYYFTINTLHRGDFGANFFKNLICNLIYTQLLAYVLQIIRLTSTPGRLNRISKTSRVRSRSFITRISPLYGESRFETIPQLQMTQKGADLETKLMQLKHYNGV